MRTALRGSLLAAFMSGLLVAGDAVPATAHGIGGRADLPVPLSFFVIGASAVLIASFVTLSFMWTTPRLQGGLQLRPLRSRGVAAFRYVLGAVGIVGFLLIVVDGLVDAKVSTLHISPVLIWVYFWLVIPFIVAFAGNIWKWISPWRTASLGLGVRETTRALPSRVGMWPAVIALVAFTWLELVSPAAGDRRALAIATIVYTVYALIAVRVYGVQAGLGSFEAFENYNGIISRIAPLAWTDGAQEAARTNDVGSPATIAEPQYGLAYRGWLRALPVMDIRPGLTAFIVAMIGTVTYDGLSGTEWWIDVFGDQSRETWFGTVALIATVAAIGVLYAAASWVGARVAGSGHTMRSVGASFAHTLVPIALAYAFAHYFTLILFEGQLLIHAASDPFGLDWNLFGTATWRVEFFLSPEVIWYVQVAAILAGHVVGIVLAHDRALFDFGDSAAQTQYAMLMLMVILTSLGLFILAG